MEPGLDLLGSAPLDRIKTNMYKVKKGFIIKNGFEGKEGQTVEDSAFTKKEIASLIKDGSIEAVKAVVKKPAKKVAKKTKKSK